MSETKWTDEQQQAIDTRKCNLLVAAAAGSGKTAVLVERIIKIITNEENPVDIDNYNAFLLFRCNKKLFLYNRFRSFF